MTTITVNGNTYTEASFAELLYVSAVLALAGDIMADAGRGLVTTSATSYTLGSGTGTITMGAAIPYAAGAYILLADTAAPTTNYALVQASAAASGTSLSFTEILVVGSGTKTAWSLTPSGPRGATGATGANGTNGTNGADGFAPGGTAASDLTMAGYRVIQPVFQDYSEVVVTANTGTSYGINLDNGNVFNLTLTGNVTYTFAGHSAVSARASSFTLFQTQDGSGLRTVTWPASVVWEGGTAPTVTATAGAADVFVFSTPDQGTTWFGKIVGQNFS